MPGTPYYLITSCCNQSTTQGQYLIPGSGVVSNGVYVYNGPTFLETDSGMWFYSGYCYEVQYLGTDFSFHPTGFNSSDITLSVGNTCESSDCASCEAPIPAGFEVYNCCDAANSVYVNIDISGCDVVNGTWNYTGPLFTTVSGFVFNTGECYYVSSVEAGIYEEGPKCTDFTGTNKGYNCAEAQLVDGCPACDLGLQYLEFQSCCDKDALFYFKGNDATSYFGIKEYLGPLTNGLENTCYAIRINNVGDGSIQTIDQYNALLDPPLYVEGVTFSTISNTSLKCTEFKSVCPDCNPQCYTLYGCNGESFNTTVNLSTFINEFINITDYTGSISGPWLVKETTGPCENAVNTIAFYNFSVPCSLTCYTATGEGEITYIDEYKNIVTIYSPAQFCSYIYPTTSPGISILQGTDCVNNGNGFECQDYCFKLKKCNEDVYITSNSQTLIPYYTNNNIVTLNGYDGCWQVTDMYTGGCDCPVPLTVLTSFANCEECLPIVAYKFTNCENPSLVLYSSEDFSQYVGLSLQNGCDKLCYSVSQIDYAPPVESTITTNYLFDGCAECLGNYYRLTDCIGNLPDVITSTNLQDYLGQVIKIKNCDTCWSVSEGILVAGQVSEIVSLDSVYQTGCEECLESKPLQCSTIRNDSEYTQVFDYIDYTGAHAFQLAPGQTSEKICVLSWIRDSLLYGYIEYFGTCVDNQCPTPVLPARFVKPGYNTPVCDAEKWDKITCKSSEILYKMVLKARYGISNCCDAPDDKWLIKKELIDLAALVDPNYTCTVSSCGCTTDTCGCGCSSTPKTCNSN